MSKLLSTLPAALISAWIDPFLSEPQVNSINIAKKPILFYQMMFDRTGKKSIAFSLASNLVSHSSDQKYKEKHIYMDH